MRSTIVKKWTLCGVMASAVMTAAAFSLPVMSGGCGANETLVYGHFICDDAGADAGGGGQGGEDSESTTTMCP